MTDSVYGNTLIYEDIIFLNLKNQIWFLVEFDKETAV